MIPWLELTCEIPDLDMVNPFTNAWYRPRQED